MRDVLLVIPAYNEANNISRVLESVLQDEMEYDVLVINDGSLDSTCQKAKYHNVDVVSHPFNMGYGCALQTGFKYAAARSYKYVVQFDADGQHNVKNIKPIIDELRKGDVDIVVGSRFMGKGKLKNGFLKNAVLTFFKFMIFICSGVKVTDPTSGLKGLSSRLFKYYSKMGRFPADYPDADVLIKTLRFGFKLGEIPVEMNERLSGKSMHTGLKPLYYVMKVLLSILTVLLREKFYKEGCDSNEFNC